VRGERGPTDAFELVLVLDAALEHDAFVLDVDHRTAEERAALQAQQRREDGEPDRVHRLHSESTAAMHATMTMSSALQPRERSMYGFERPWTKGPSATAPPRRSTSL